MRQKTIPSAIRFFLLLSAFQLSCAQSYADKGVINYLPATPKPLEGRAQSFSAGSSQTAPLQGGIKEQSSLNPSLRLTPQLRGRAEGQGFSLHPMQGQYVPEQIRGGVHTAGSEAGISAGPVQFLGDTPRGGSPGMHGVISPISSYHSTPASGVINYIPGSSTLSVTQGGIQSQDALPKQYQTIGHGVTVLAPELTVSTMSRVMPIPMFSGGGGGGRLVLSTMQSSSVQMIAPGMNLGNVVTNCLGGNDGPQYVTRRGVTTAPGYEVTISPPGLSKETLGGSWSTKPTSPIELTALANPMQTQHIFNRIEPAAEIARAGVLGDLQAPKCDTWPQWYRAIAKSIYTNWQMIDVCPGTAKLEVTVKANHVISGQVIDFTPAPDIARNVPRETEFREAAVKIVNQLNFFEIPDFPNPPSEQVVFDIDLKRTVDGPTGASVVGVPSK